MSELSWHRQGRAVYISVNVEASITIIYEDICWNPMPRNNISEE